MSTDLFKGLQPRSAGSGLSLPDNFSVVPDPIDRRDRYVISPGETLKLAHRQLCRNRIRQGYIERIFLNTPKNYNFDEIDLNKYDENTVPPGHARIEFDWPVTQVRDLMHYRENGLVDLQEFLGMSVTDIEDIESAVLPPVECLMWQLREYLTNPRYAVAQIEHAPIGSDMKDIAMSVRETILGGIEVAWAYQTLHLDEREGEMQDRMMPGGRGQAQLSDRERHFYKNLNRTPPAGRQLEREGERENPGGIKQFIAEMIGGKQNDEMALMKQQIAESQALLKQLSEQNQALIEAQKLNSKPAATEAKKPTGGQVNRNQPPAATDKVE